MSTSLNRFASVNESYDQPDPLLADEDVMRTYTVIQQKTKRKFDIEEGEEIEEAEATEATEEAKSEVAVNDIATVGKV